MTAARVLAYGQFIGQTADEVIAQGFSFRELRHRPGEEVPLHTHADPHFLLIVDGDYVTTARGPQGGCRPGSLIFNPPGTTHRDRFRSTTGRFFTLSLQPERYRVLSDAGAFREGATCYNRGQQTWLAARMYREFHRRDSLSPTVLEGMALELLGATGRQERFRGNPPAWVAVAVELIQDRCATALSVREIAAEVGVHPYHLCRSFRRFLGQTPSEFLRACRIERADQLLRSSNLTTAAIALQCGYADQSQFTRSFRHATGTTPARLRREWQCGR